MNNIVKKSSDERKLFQAKPSRIIKHLTTPKSFIRVCSQVNLVKEGYLRECL